MAALLAAVCGCAKASLPDAGRLWGRWIPERQQRLIAMELLPTGGLMLHYAGFACTGCWELREAGVYMRYYLDGALEQGTYQWAVDGDRLRMGDQVFVRAASPDPVDYP